MKVRNFIRLFILPIIIGVIGGFSAILMRELIKYSSFFADKINIFETNSIFYLAIIPIIFFASSFVINKFMSDTTNPTIDSVAKTISLKKGRLDYKKGIASVALTAINIGFGVPVGREGPIAKLGGSLSSFALKLIDVKGMNIPLLVTCGVSSALAATFNAPVAAIIFGLEIILGRLSFGVIIPLSVSSAVGTIISRYFLGNYPAFYVHKLTYNYIFLLLIPAFAVFFALIVIFFEYTYKLLIESFRILKLSIYSKALIGGLVVGVLLYLYPDAASLGYDNISKLFLLKYSYGQALDIGFIKILVLAITFASGMFGGVFAPSIFTGAFLGFAAGGLIHSIVPSIDPLSIALIGTSAVTASVSSAPLRSTLIVAELSQNYDMIIPLILTSATTMYFSYLFQKKIHFTRSAMQKGFDITNEQYKRKLINMKISNFIDTTIFTLKKDDFLKNILFHLMKSSSSYFAVLESDQLVGALSFRDIRLMGEMGKNIIKVGDVMTTNPSFLTFGSDGLAIFEFISHIDVDYIPIVNNENDKIYMGMLDVNSFLKFASFLYLESGQGSPKYK